MSLSIYFIKMKPILPRRDPPNPSLTLSLVKGEGEGGDLEGIDRCALWC